MKSEHGSALIGALIGATILGIVTAGFSSMMASYNREAQSLSQKMEILTLQQTAIGVLANGATCGCMFDPSKNTDLKNVVPFDSSKANSLPLTNLYSSCAGGKATSPIASVGASLAGSSVKVSSITIDQPANVPNNTVYTANLTIAFDPSSMNIQRNAIVIPVNMVANSGTPGSTTITSCAVGGPPVGPGSGSGGGTGGTGGSGSAPPQARCSTKSCGGGCTCGSGQYVAGCLVISSSSTTQLADPNNGSSRITTTSTSVEPGKINGLNCGNPPEPCKGKNCGMGGLAGGGTAIATCCDE